MKLDMTFHQTDQSFAAEFERLQAVSSVISVNGKTGAVQLTAEDVGALAQDAVQTKAIICTASEKIMKAEDSTEYALKGLTLYGKTTQNGTPALDAPAKLESVGSDGTVGIQVEGKNLFDAEKFYATRAGKSNGVERVTRKGDVFTITFTSAGVYLNVYKSILFPAGTYTLSAFSDDEFHFQAMLYDAKTGDLIRGKSKYLYHGNTVWTFEVAVPFALSIGGTMYTNEEGYYVARVGTYSFKLQLEAGTAATEYERYKAPQTLTVQTPNGLPGIPVTSGGSYTDENGQQWLCDEVDFVRGVYVQRIARIDSYTGEAVGDAFLSTTGELSKGATVLYPLAEVLETALTEEDLAQYTALHTYYPVTTVLNDSGAQMKLGYVADTKNYIDKKFIELQNAILSLGGNV